MNGITSESFLKTWNESYSDCPPVGYLLRERFSEIWFRVHSLPSSKRYAETEEEAKEILRRHNSILNDLLGDESKYVLIATDYSSEPEPVTKHFNMSALGQNMEYLSSFPYDEPGESDEAYFWHLFMAERTWRSGSVDSLLALVAEEEIQNVLLVDLEQGWVYHPYDGGADVIVKSEERRKRMMDRYLDWLPQEPV